MALPNFSSKKLYWYRYNEKLLYLIAYGLLKPISLNKHLKREI